MKIWYSILFIAYLVIAVYPEKPDTSKLSVSAAVNYLGLDDSTYNEFDVIVPFLDNHTESAIGLLINQLDTVHLQSETCGDLASYYKKANHIIWCITILHHLTGKVFLATTKHKFTPEEEYRDYWLHAYDDRKVTFCHIWMSRDRCYIAPIDAQEKIISKWKKWFKKNNRHIQIHILKNLNDWYFG